MSARSSLDNQDISGSVCQPTRRMYMYPTYAQLSGPIRARLLLRGFTTGSMTGSSLALVCSRTEVLLHRKAGFRRSWDNAGTLASTLLVGADSIQRPGYWVKSRMIREDVATTDAPSNGRDVDHHQSCVMRRNACPIDLRS